MLRNFTLDDASPLIRYDATWDDGFNSSFDDQFAKYQGQSFQCTNIDGATANLTFRGTAIYVYGAKRSNHGYYRVAMNGEENPAVSGRPPSGQPNQFQTLLFSKEGLPDGENTMELTNIREGDGLDYVDIDYIVITREVDESNDSRRTLVSHDQFTYTSLWTTQLNCKDIATHRHIQQIPRVRKRPSSSVALRFVYGGVGPAFGMFGVEIDGQDWGVLNATRAAAGHPSVTLFAISSLGNGDHTLSLTNLEGGKSLTIGYAEYTPGKSGSGSNGGLIGGVVGGVLGALVVLTILGWYLIRRRRRARHAPSEDQLPPMSSVTSTQAHWNNEVQITPYMENSGQPPVGYTEGGTIYPSTHTPSVSTAIRKADVLAAPLPVLRSGESSYALSSQFGASVPMSPGDRWVGNLQAKQEH
ncbi:hypothetical protein RhiXN_10192 [Rhizoctonia solani]|uniref:Transmembrane protein n=1 Tax=Rhizoctonia solani TaxID=456999 RepID=A0A8H8P3A2_9AGAM|nr:uncharacterized protein RhiXN_10192 [Rhizoctonia solani]QRW23868.1 hypothetical protein RhiXN_10192 [Rhizoctonia solani]